MRRRDFIQVIIGSAAWPLIARAQQRKLPTIGFLGSTASATGSPWVAAFVQRLDELGWIDGRTVAIEYRWFRGRPELAANFAAEFVRLNVDVIVTPGGATSAVMHATSTIPILFTSALDPVGTGFVASLAKPGGNVTGLSLQSTDSVSKRLGFLREVVPGLHRLATITNAGNSGNVLETREVLQAAHMLGFDESTTFEISRMEDISRAFDDLKDNAQALYVVNSPLTTTNRSHIATLALQRRLPAVYGARDFVDVGGLMSYGARYEDLYRHAADLVDKVLRGTKPVDIPVEQPTKFELVINLTTAKALGLTIPASLLSLADELIE